MWFCVSYRFVRSHLLAFAENDHDALGALRFDRDATGDRAARFGGLFGRSLGPQQSWEAQNRKQDRGQITSGETHSVVPSGVEVCARHDSGTTANGEVNVLLLLCATSVFSVPLW